MQKIQANSRRAISRSAFVLAGLLLSALYSQNSIEKHHGSGVQRGISLFFSYFPIDIVMVDGFLAPSTHGNSLYQDTFGNRCRSASKRITTNRCRRRNDSKIRQANHVSVTQMGQSNADTDNDSAEDEQVLEKLWSYVKNLQRDRKRKGEMKAVYSLSHYLSSNTIDNEENGRIQSKIKIFDDKEVDDNDGEEENFIARITEVLERCLVPAIRQAGESNDYRMILRLISGSIGFANDRPILTPRIFGEALNALSLTTANVGKVKSVWNTMIGNANDSSSLGTPTEEVDSSHLPLFLNRPPTAFELNTYLKSLAARGKWKACVDAYRTHCMRQLEDSTESLSHVYIQPDAYTISILLSILADSISQDQNMCDPVEFSTVRTGAMPTVKHGVHDHRSVQSATEQLRSKMESLTYSTCWQWNIAVEILGALPDSDHNGMSKLEEGKIEWRSNHVYSALLKLQEKAQDLCDGKNNSSGQHKNGPELTMSILDDMIQREIMPDAVTCTQAIKAMGRAAVNSNNLLSVASVAATKNASEGDVDGNNLAVNFLERMKSDPKLPQPNQYTYSAAIKACARLKDHRTASHLLEEMRIDQCSTNVSSDATIPPPNTWVYNAVLLSLDNKQRSKSKQTKKRFKNKQMKKLWNQKNNEMNQEERTDLALRLLDQMVNDSQRYNLDTKPDTVTYNTVLGVGSFPHQFNTTEMGIGNVTEMVASQTIRSLSLIDRMEKEGIPRDTTTYCNAIDSSIHHNDTMDILQKFLLDSSFMNRKPRKCEKNAMTSVFNSALNTLTAKQDFSKFKNVLTLMFDHEITTNDETLTAVIYGVGKYGKGSSLVNLIELIETSEDQHSSTDLSMHQQFLESIEFIEHGNSISKLPMPSDFHYSQAINICLKENEFSDAYAILSKMRAKGINPTTSCMEGFALAYAQSAMDSIVQGKKGTSQHEEKLISISLFRASSAYKIAMALSLPRSSTLGRVARACAMTGQWKLCRALLQSIHNKILAPNEDGSPDIISPRHLQTIRGTHSYVLRECAKQGSVHAALHYTNDIQEFSKKIRAKNQPGAKIQIEEPKFAEILPEEDDVFKNLRSITDNPLSKTNVGMQPNDWMSVIEAASKSGHWRVCFNTLQFLRPYVERTKLIHGENNNDSNHERYNQLTYALHAVTLSLESHSQYAWAVRVIEDWIEWSGRQPRVESVLSAIRVLSANERVEEIRKLIDACVQKESLSFVTKEKKMSYEGMLYVGTVTALHNNGLYDDADEFFMSGIQDGFLPFNFYREKEQFVLDLHGLNVALAHSVVRIAMRQQAATLAGEETSQSNMMIITGRGRNSELHLRPILRPEVQRMLLEEFYPPLNSMSVPGNIGALTVLAQDIEAWQQQQQQQKGIRMLKLASVLRNLSSPERLKKVISLKLESERNGGS